MITQRYYFTIKTVFTYTNMHTYYVSVIANIATTHESLLTLQFPQAQCDLTNTHFSGNVDRPAPAGETVGSHLSDKYFMATNQHVPCVFRYKPSIILRSV